MELDSSVTAGFQPGQALPTNIIETKDGNEGYDWTPFVVNGYLASFLLKNDITPDLLKEWCMGSYHSKDDLMYVTLLYKYNAYYASVIMVEMLHIEPILEYIIDTEIYMNKLG